MLTSALQKPQTAESESAREQWIGSKHVKEVLISTPTTVLSGLAIRPRGICNGRRKRSFAAAELETVYTILSVLLKTLMSFKRRVKKLRFKLTS